MEREAFELVRYDIRNKGDKCTRDSYYRIYSNLGTAEVNRYVMYITFGVHFDQFGVPVQHELGMGVHLEEVFLTAIKE